MKATLTLVKYLLVLVPVSFLPALVVWFFADVIFGASWQLLAIWRMAYLTICGGGVVVISVALAAVLIITISRSLRFGVTMAEGLESLRLKILTFREGRRLTPEEFREALMQGRLREQLKSRVAETLYEVFRNARP